jgi:hypothetical protein
MTMGTLNDELIGGFYAAAAGEMTWPQALSPLLQDFEAWGVTLFGIDMQLGAVDFSFEAGDVKPEASIDYIRTWHRHDPRGLSCCSCPWANGTAATTISMTISLPTVPSIKTS